MKTRLAKAKAARRRTYPGFWICKRRWMSPIFIFVLPVVLPISMNIEMDRVSNQSQCLNARGAASSTCGEKYKMNVKVDKAIEAVLDFNFLIQTEDFKLMFRIHPAQPEKKK